MTVLTLPRAATPSVAALDLPRVQRNNPLITRRSVRFNRGDSPALTRVFGAGNRKTFTCSAWFKPARSWGDFGTGRVIMGVNGGASDTLLFQLALDVGDRISVSGNSTTWRLSAARLRDCSAWYHLVVAVDTNQAAADDRIKVWLNGVQITSWTTNNAIGSAADTGMNNSGQTHLVFSNLSGGAGEFDGNVAEVVFADGYQGVATDFGLFDANGVWQPKRYGGVFGVNGFRLTFENPANLGLDSSPVGNNLTVTNLVTTAGAGNDQLADTPSNNFCVMNRQDNATLIPLNGNLDIPAANSRGCRATFAVERGKWYWEITASGAGSCNDGICNQSFGLGAYLGSDTNSLAYVGNTVRYNAGVLVTAADPASGAGVVLGIELDATERIIAFYVNNALQYRGPIPFTGPYYPAVSYGTGIVGYTASYNFGQRPFTYPRDPAWKTLCATNLPEPMTRRPRRHFDAVLYTGDASASQRSIQGLQFKPDLTIFKNRTAAANFVVLDQARGYGQSMFTNTTAGNTAEGELVSLDERGVTVLRNGTFDRLNTSAGSFIALGWRKGPHFDLRWVSHTNGAATTVGFEGLAGNIQLAMVKRTDAARAWSMFFEGLTAGNLVNWESTAAEAGDTSFTVSGRQVTISSALPTGSYLVLAFTSVDGLCRVGRYTGNGASAGPYVFTGFRPRFLMAKRRAGGVANFQFLDTVRNPHNTGTMARLLFNDAATTESALRDIDLHSNGFKIRETDVDWNASAEYVYLAMADTTFKAGRAA